MAARTAKAIEFSGQGTYEVKKGHITSPDTDFEVHDDGNGTLRISPEEGSEISVSTGARSTVTHFGTVTGGVFNTGITNLGPGMQVAGMQIGANQDMRINGIRYRPYTIGAGRLAGRTAFAPEDYVLTEAGSAGAAAPAPQQARRPKTSTRDYAVAMLIGSLDVSGGAVVTIIDPEVVATALSIDASSGSRLDVRACVIDVLNVDASSGAHVAADVRCGSACLDSSSGASITGPMAERVISADASSAGTIVASAAFDAVVSREASTSGRVTISRY